MVFFPLRSWLAALLALGRLAVLYPWFGLAVGGGSIGLNPAFLLVAVPGLSAVSLPLAAALPGAPRALRGIHLLGEGLLALVFLLLTLQWAGPYLTLNVRAEEAPWLPLLLLIQAAALITAALPPPGEA